MVKVDKYYLFESKKNQCMSGNRVCLFEAMGGVLKRNVMRWFGHVDKRENTGIWKSLQR